MPADGWHSSYRTSSWKAPQERTRRESRTGSILNRTTSRWVLAPAYRRVAARTVVLPPSACADVLAHLWTTTTQGDPAPLANAPMYVSKLFRSH
jgi:hypothetical protein